MEDVVSQELGKPTWPHEDPWGRHTQTRNWSWPVNMSSMTNVKSGGSTLLSCKDSQGCQGAADNRCKGPRGSETWSHWGDGWGPDEAGLNPGPEKWRLLRELTAEPGQVFKWGLPSTSTVPECSSIGMVSKPQAHGEHSVLHWWWCLLGMCEEEECQGRPGCGRSQKWWARGLIPNYPALKLSSFPVSQ